MGCALTVDVYRQMDWGLASTSWRWQATTPRTMPDNKETFHRAIISYSVRQAVTEMFREQQVWHRWHRYCFLIVPQNKKLGNNEKALPKVLFFRKTLLKPWSFWDCLSPCKSSHINIQGVPRSWIHNLKGMAVSRCKILNNLWEYNGRLLGRLVINVKFVKKLWALKKGTCWISYSRVGVASAYRGQINVWEVMNLSRSVK